MMSEEKPRKKVDLQLLFSANKDVSVVQPVTLPPHLYVLGAVLVDFSRAVLQEFDQAIYGHQLSDEEWALFAEHLVKLPSDPLTPEAEVTWVLAESERVRALKGVQSRDELAPILTRLTGRTDCNLIEQMLIAYLNGIAPAPRAQSLAELSATFTVRRWLQDTLFGVPDEKTISVRMKQEEILEPFRTLTSDFKGRVDQLAQLADYVDWIPAGSAYAGTLRAARHFLGDGDRPLLIHGEGGVGKSSLLAKFVLDHLNFEGRAFQLPFIYFDFDRPGLSIADPFRLITDACRQLALQFPNQDHYFNEINDYIKNERLKTDIKSRSSDLEYLFARYAENLMSSPAAGQPVLLLLDSFEELQYRAQNIEFIDFFKFLSTLKKLVPRLRVVMAGRSETLSEIKVETLALADLEPSVAKAYLKDAGVSSEKANFIVREFGGNPLSLKAAAGVVRNAPANTPIETLFRDISGTLIQQKLISRNLHHLHGDPRLKQLAIPGVVVRRLSPEIIQKVLAGPCGLGELTISDAERLFKDLCKHVFMIEQRGEVWSFRQDVRESMELLIKESPEYHVNDVHRSAISYYENARTTEGRAEYIYHRLKLGGNIFELIDQIDADIRPYLETSIREFLPDTQIVLAARFGTAVNSDHLAVVSEETWAYFVQAQERSGLISRDVSSLETWARWFARRPRSYDPRLWLIECQVNERLGNLNFAEWFATERYFQRRDPVYVKIILSLARTYEINRMYARAVEVLQEIDAMAMVSDWPLLLEYVLLQLRNSARSDQPFARYDRLPRKLVEECLQNCDHPADWPFIYQEVARRNNLRDLIDFVKQNEFLGEKQFVDRYQIREKEAGSSSTLERLVRSRFSLTLKEISMPGSLRAAAHDVSLFAELDDLLKNRISSNAKDKAPSLSKRLVICCDGLWYPSSQTKRDILLKTNVEKLYNALVSQTPDGIQQVSIYERCVLEQQTFFGKFLGQLSLQDIRESVRNIYYFIVSNYQPGDELFFFGFSKGAYIVRAVVGLIRKCGILKQSDSKKIEEAIELYFNRSIVDNVDGKEATKFRGENAHPLPEVTFLGVWETIGALGIPFSLLQIVQRRSYQFHDNVLSRIVKNAYQALALDERRAAFKPALWAPSRSKKAAVNQLEQRWFAGTHADIGGGYAESGLSDISLLWMLSKAQERGLYFDNAFLAGLRPDPLAEIHRSLTIESFLSTSIRQPKLDNETCQYIDGSVLHRMEQDRDYSPSNVVGTAAYKQALGDRLMEDNDKMFKEL
ncbi:phospholipase effector Tle1 domain-containing protein [Mucilaginibacter sp. R-33]|uniref:phospholipase effector Tle1 domain-containing protein n=1 Tax=Mucilaginibacter sp. R-33 TaxID=3416711 RepID=UPI003CF5C03E